MDHRQRYKKLRLLVRKVNKERRKQAKKIDILCNDLIAAQRDFIKKLSTISFTANFYEAIIGTTDWDSLFYTAGRFIKNEIPDANIAFFLRQEGSFELHVFESDHPITLEEPRLENCFTPQLVENICRANKLCTLDDMFAMELQGSPAYLNKISAVTVPLGWLGLSLGFILIYRSSEKGLTDDELSNITAVTCGLSRAIQSRHALLHSVD
jgi:hypothetical protein